MIMSQWVNGSMAVTHDPLTHFHLWFVLLPAFVCALTLCVFGIISFSLSSNGQNRRPTSL